MIISNTIITVLMHHWSQNGVSPTGRSAEPPKCCITKSLAPALCGALRTVTKLHELTRVVYLPQKTVCTKMTNYLKSYSNLKMISPQIENFRKISENLGKSRKSPKIPKIREKISKIPKNPKNLENP